MERGMRKYAKYYGEDETYTFLEFKGIIRHFAHTTKKDVESVEKGEHE